MMATRTKTTLLMLKMPRRMLTKKVMPRAALDSSPAATAPQKAARAGGASVAVVGVVAAAALRTVRGLLAIAPNRAVRSVGRIGPWIARASRVRNLVRSVVRGPSRDPSLGPNLGPSLVRLRDQKRLVRPWRLRLCPGPTRSSRRLGRCMATSGGN
jgi:hypothetical protein